jgi:uncharacterized protein YbaA (DUF1428 family)
MKRTTRRCWQRPLLALGALALVPVGFVGMARADDSAGVAEAVAAAARLATASASGGNAERVEDADRIAAIPPAMLVPCLAAFAEATPGGVNWLTNGLDRAVERMGDQVPLAELTAFVADPTRPARARTLAYRWLRSRDESTAAALLDGMLNDPALPLRRAALEKRLVAVADAAEPEQIAVHREMLAAARDVDQVQTIAAWLREHGDEVNVSQVLGFVTNWRVSETFDNVGGIGYAAVYPPEQAAVAPEATTWKEVAAEGDQGAVDLNAALGTLKGVVSYAVAEVDMPRGGTAEVRIGSPCAVVVWVNGEKVIDREVYHASEAIDQYVGEATFRAGTNTVLVKCCQNEQTESWAADWKFQLRICDSLGTPLGVQP